MATLLGVVACGGRVSREAYDRVENGMTMEQVVAILGEPTETASIGIGPLSGTTAQWVTSDLRIDVQFFNDKVRLKTLQDR